MTEDETRTVLEIEAAKGDRYKHIYTDILEPFFNEKQQVLFDAFKTVNATDTDSLVAIKMQSTALESLQSEFETAIETGRMATHQLNATIEKDKENG
mgnify:CR=1 FL=1